MRMPTGGWMFWIALLAVLGQGCGGQGPPVSPEDSLATFELPPGFRLELVAAEPDVVDPVAMTFDARGRLFVVEMRDYPLGPEPKGQVKMLEDRDGDGRYEQSSVFAAGLSLPSGVMAWRDGILVTAAPDVIYFADTDGDGKADIREVVLTGFAATNPQLRVNGPLYGIDNWIYLAYPRVPSPVRYAKEFGDPGGPIHSPLHPGRSPVDIRSLDVRFKPGDGLVEAVAGNSQFGNAFDAWGNRFTVWNNDHVRHVVVSQNYVAQNPYLTSPARMHSASDHENAAALFPVTSNPLYIHDSQHGRFTSASGISIYTGGRFPAGYEHSSFTCDPVHNLVHRDVLVPDGPTFRAQRAHENSEFLASTNAWFRPVFTATGPDGAFYVADYHRPVVEHPEYAPREIHDHIRFLPPAEAGRIYRVVHESSGPSKQVKLHEASADELVAHLSDPNMWVRMTAQRLLVERQDKSATGGLERLASSKDSALGRLHALWTLEGLGALSPGLVSAALNDPDARIREHALRLAEAVLPKEALKTQAMRLVNDPNEKVELLAASMLSLLPGDDTFRALESVLARHIESPWFQTAVLASAADNADRWIETLVRKPGFAGAASDGKTKLLNSLASIVGARQKDREVAKLAGAAARGRSEASLWWRQAVLKGLETGLGRGEQTRPRLPDSQRALIRLANTPANARQPGLRDGALASLQRLRLGDSPALRTLIQQASKTASDENHPPEDRVHAIRLLGLDPAGQTSSQLQAFLNPRSADSLQVAAVEALDHLLGAAAAPILLEHWRAYTGPVRLAAVNGLFRHKASLVAVMEAIEAGDLQPWSLSRGRQRQLLRHPDEAMRRRAAVLFSDFADRERQSVYETFRPALSMTGSSEDGRRVFGQVCADCHKIGSLGTEVGPDLLGVVIRNKEVLMTDILMPNETIEAGYEEYLLETTDGRSLSGVIAEQTADSVTLRRAKGEQDIVPRASIAALRSLSVSPMPEDLEKDMSLQDMADLLAYLKSL